MSEFRIFADDSITSYKFYNILLPQINNFLLHQRSQKLILDLTKTKFIEPNIIPSFMSLGMLLKDRLNEPVDLFIPWNPAFIHYLYEIGFLERALKYKIYSIDERFIGGADFTKKRLDKSSTTLMFSKNTEKQEIYNSLLHSSKIFEKVYGGSVFWSDNISSRNINAILEVCDNASRHSNSEYFFVTIQYLESDFIGLSISISDYGIGFNGSFLFKEIDNKKLDNKGFLISEVLQKLYKINIHDNIYHIFNACFYRMFEDEYGLFQICRDNLKNKNSRIRIHSNDTQLILTNKNAYELFSNSNDINFIAKYLMREFVLRNPSNRMLSNVRRIPFPGVHLEIVSPNE